MRESEVAVIATEGQHTERLRGEYRLEMAVDMCGLLGHNHMTSTCACVLQGKWDLL